MQDGNFDEQTPVFEAMNVLNAAILEAKSVVDEMKITKDLEKKKVQSEILKNLCESAGVFFSFMSDAMLAEDFPFLDEYDEEGEDFI